MKFASFVAAPMLLAFAVLLGHVTDATTGQPLVGVTIAVGSHHAVTDKHGAYRIAGLKAGHYTLSASSNDVLPQHRTVDVTANRTQTLDLVLCSTSLDYGCTGGGPG